MTTATVTKVGDNASVADIKSALETLGVTGDKIVVIPSGGSVILAAIEVA